MSPADLTRLSAIEMTDAYRARTLSPVETADALLAQIERCDSTINAFGLVAPEVTLAQAQASEDRWLAGNPAGGLDGVPVAVKDVFLTSGWPTLRGSRAVDPAGPWRESAPAVCALSRHGALLLGKTTTPEFGWKAVTDSPLTGITRNPWELSRTAGGSSGGSAAALASGMAPLALGTDGGGSIRIPSAFCGVVGLKPTFGRVPAWPASPFGLLAHAGPMARTMADLALMLDVISEPDPRDWGALPSPPASFRDQLEGGIRGARVAFSADLGYVRVDPEVATAIERAAATLAELGAHVEQVDPGFEDPREAFDVLWGTGAVNLMEQLGNPPAAIFDPGLVRLAEANRSRSAVDLLEANRRRDTLGLAMSLFHQRFDLLVTPTVPIPAFEAGRNVPPGWPEPHWPSWTPFTYPFNLTQQPAASLPCGLTSAGLPVGLQIVGPRYGDELVLRAARAYEAAANVSVSPSIPLNHMSRDAAAIPSNPSVTRANTLPGTKP